MKTMKSPFAGAMLVHVCSYTRIRFGNLEWVTTHFRRYPRS
jgi:hypothetical protein